MSKLEMLTVAADLVESETYEERSDKVSNHKGSRAAESNDNTPHNGTHEATTKSEAELVRPSNNYHDKGHRDDIKPLGGRNVERTNDSNLTQEAPRLYNYSHHRTGYTENSNGTLPHSRHELFYPKSHEDNISPAGKSPDSYPATIHRRSSSPASERGGDTHSTTKPMVLLQQPTSTTLSSVGSAHARLANPASIPYPTMHHSYMYHPLLAYQPAAGLDSVLGTAMSRAPGVLKDGEGLVSSPSRSSSDGLPAVTAAGLHIPGLVYPFANHPALIMAARPPTTADMPPAVLGQPSNPYPALDQYKRVIEGLQYSSYAGLHPQLTDQYLKTLAAAQGLDVSKEALALSAMAGRIPSGLSLAAQPGAELLLRYHDWPAAMNILRPPAGVSPRAGSPFASKMRTESPSIPNGGKTTAPSYPFHPALVQSQINNLGVGHNLSRSPATLLPQGPRSRSPPVEIRKPDVDRSGFRPRDLDTKPGARELTSAAVTNNNGRGRNNSSEQVPPYSVTDESGRKIPVPAFFGQPPHIPYAAAMTSHHLSRERSPSPRSRDERSYHRQQRERSPIGVEAKRRPLESHHLTRDSPAVSDRHNSRPSSPLTNGLGQAIRSKMPVVNGNTEIAVTADIAKHNPHFLLPPSHTRSPNPAGFGVDSRDQRNSTPPTNPYLVAGGIPPYFNSPLIPGLGTHAGAHYMLPPQYAQALAKSSADMSSLYKAAGENSDIARLAQLQLLQHQQWLAGVGARPPGLQQEYLTALNKNPAYFTSQASSRDSGKSSPANIREKLPIPPTQMHSSLLGQVPPKAHSPVKVGVKPTKSNDSPQMGKPTHHQRPETRSPATSNSALPQPESRRYHHSPNADRDGRPSQDLSPKQQQQSSKPYRPSSMLRQHASDLERSRKRKLMGEAMREDGGNNAFVRENHRNDRERDYHLKDERKDPKRVKQLISENDPEEHFRRSLGKDYKETSNKVNISGSVDEHFKKALGSMYEQVHGAGVKTESREVASSSASHLPPYSVASQSSRMYPAPHQDVKESTTARYYDQPFLPRDRYYRQPSPHHNRKVDKSPPGVPSGGTTVIYPQHPSVAPPRQKVKAKAAFIPEASESHMVARPGRSNSDGSKNSRNMSGSSMENIPAVMAKSPPTASPPAATTSDASRPIVPVISQGIPFSFAHQTNAVGGNIDAASTNNAVSQHMRNSPTSSSRKLVEHDEQTKLHLSGSPPRGYSAAVSSNHRESTESVGKEGKGST